VGLRAPRIDLDYLPELAGRGLPILLSQESHALLEVQVRRFGQRLLSGRLRKQNQSRTKHHAAK
jgi:hypothetical protein